MLKNRHFKIIYHLLSQQKTTAYELAKLLEVSPRTIYRDIDVLSSLEIPIYAEAGRNGGIYLLDNYVLDRVLLSKEEQQTLLLAINGIKNIDSQGNLAVISKLQSLFNIPFDNWLEIEFKSWHAQNQIDDTFDIIKSAILQRRQINFAYTNLKGMIEARTCKPVKLIFKAHSWYLQAYSIERSAFRIFKINRMQQIQSSDVTFSPISAPPIEAYQQAEYLELTLLFSKAALYRVFDEFSHREIKLKKDGTAMVTTQIPNEEWLIRYLLSFGKNVTVLKPKNIRHKLMKEIKSISLLYDNQ
ncbi:MULTISPECIES: YafY family protein [unclassified Enterococcus]|uniref:helix-turn-helix transcriptional regulator n=1 Tax=unclassified Enterococcus TaxID=2608891 RepID=UPI001553AE69|nr:MULTISPECIES: YafY family protein [unclassified Enterococcus]MBS7578244.1 YafY family transcriptional regulator [Enterococcus sp. MMGLQ5-2]MBS7585517.1 YafY family transcriptional regulator [Enterococcus sp. MMGLQ5-1]NPD13376.1 YafY family transcriptional regulator [Enterococcus sp. MMGLQ5-1]NPD38075.1 YafY family transcriptional regulator [Enterococcus sp. MMGLQ5-2]